MTTTTIAPVTTADTLSGTLETFTVDPTHSEVGFSVRHLLSRTRGRFAKFTAEIRLDRARPERSSVTFEVDPASIDTRQTDRDAHLRSGDFFDVENHPVVRFTSSRMEPAGGEHYRVEGTLELRGVRKPLVLDVEYHGVANDPWGGQRAGFSTKAKLDRKEFGIVWNAALDNGGLLLGDEVELTLDLETVRQS